MNMTDKLLADFIVVGIICGLYLQYRGFKAMEEARAKAERKNRVLTRAEALKLAEAFAYAFMGAWFETLSISQAVLS